MSRWPLVAGCVGLLVALAGCAEAEPRPQWRVHLATDAPIPQFGDRVLVEILVADDDGTLAPCLDCQRQLVGDVPGRWPISFGIAVPEDGAEVWVRSRLYRSAEVDELGLPATDIVIDLLAKLPPADGVLEVGAVLDADCVGVPADLNARSTCDPASANIATGLTLSRRDDSPLPKPNSWPPAKRIDCAGEPPDPDMRCIPGALVIMGSSKFLPVLGDILRPLPERLVQVSPFWMDVDEMTVGELKAHVLAGDVAAPPPGADCTYDDLSTENDALPITCVRFATAEATCRAQNKTLPTEAQWEHAASNAGRETEFPFDVVLVSSEALCTFAVVGTAAAGEGSTACLDVLGPGLRPGGSPNDLNDFGIRNLAGHVSEWVLDRLTSYMDESCWGSGPEILSDPLCTADTPFRSTRGGDWVNGGAIARSASRNGAEPATFVPSLGFRCVAAAEPAP